MKRTIKSVVGYSVFASRLERLLLRGSATVVTFHRVDPQAGRDSLTMKPDEFDSYCRFFKRHFDVVPLQTIVAALERRRRTTGQLAITFDDGYQDNFEHAAPILEAHGLPATFFIVSRWMETDTIAWWDRVAPARYPWMVWDEVRSLHARGFEIGAHTRTHVDLGTTDGETARDEILGAREDLEHVLGAPVRSFAYPYGGREHMSERNRTRVREAGFHCCCSAYGGVNARVADPFRIRRIPIAPGCVSPSEFGFDLALQRTVMPPRLMACAEV